MNRIERHVAGATVIHSSPFADLQVPVNKLPLSADIRDTWVRPLYFGLENPEAKALVAARLHLITEELISELLAHFDWRPRTVGAYLVALTGGRHFTQQIGFLLLRSDVCFAGSAYCVALAAFNSPDSIRFLDEYLTYYLTRHDLWFDQGDAMAALAYLDRLNDASNMARHMDAWGKFVADKPHWNLEGSIARFEQRMATFHALKSGMR